MSEIRDMPVSQIIPGDNDRSVFNRVALEELAESIQTNGHAQPITVRPIHICNVCGLRTAAPPFCKT